ncbi:MAG: DUF308 domain-containing protein [Chitinophaga sp.]|uniref:HdeD family acid-resistance protein n=1 Tax=Chitinophaga sp. TaxID=1869181 RepID=UPI0025B96127|nr:DUF308 domain-containing protein [Chitinophaga sp.]MBV8251392.1 DUF308 domain-containing protein [Chitinophaga sp.]
MNNVIETLRSDVKNWWWYLISGLLFIAAGIAIFAKPLDGYVSLSILFSIVMIGSGISQLFFSISNSNILRGWGWILVSGILDLAIGSYLLMYPIVTMVTLPYFLGFWLTFRSCYIMGAAIDLKNLGVDNWGWVLFGGVIVLLLGALIIYYPAAGVIGIIAVSGSAFILAGLLYIYLSFQLKNIKSTVDHFKEAAGKIKQEFRQI